MAKRSNSQLRAAKLSYLFISFALCALGIVLLALPEISARVLGIVFGVLLIAYGCARLTAYFTRGGWGLLFRYDLSMGILLVLLGVLVLMFPSSVMTFLTIVLGAYIIVDGIFKLQISLDAHRYGLRQWWVLLLMALASAVCGVLLLLHPYLGSSFLMIYLGVTLLCEGIMNLSALWTISRLMKQMPRKVIDAEWYEDVDE